MSCIDTLRTKHSDFSFHIKLLAFFFCIFFFIKMMFRQQYIVQFKFRNKTKSFLPCTGVLVCCGFFPHFSFRGHFKNFNFYSLEMKPNSEISSACLKSISHIVLKTEPSVWRSSYILYIFTSVYSHDGSSCKSTHRVFYRSL